MVVLSKSDYNQKIAALLGAHTYRRLDGCLLDCSVLAAFIIRAMVLVVLMMEAAGTSETLVNFCQTTRHYNPEDSHLRTHCHENLQSYL
jgi:hypothetical protein